MYLDYKIADDNFIAQLENCSLPEDNFHHADHLRAAWFYLKTYPLAEAIARFSKTLRSYAASLGKADRYHQTITWAYLLLLNERIERSTPDLTWEQFTREHADLFVWKPSILCKYYWERTLLSDEARRTFVMPDRLEDCADLSLVPNARPSLAGEL